MAKHSPIDLFPCDLSAAVIEPSTLSKPVLAEVHIGTREGETLKIFVLDIVNESGKNHK